MKGIIWALYFAYLGYLFRKSKLDEQVGRKVALAYDALIARAVQVAAEQHRVIDLTSSDPKRITDGHDPGA